MGLRGGWAHPLHRSRIRLTSWSIYGCDRYGARAVDATRRSRQLYPSGSFPMIYSALRWVNGIALHWFYSDIPVTGRNNIPVDAPLLIAVNHQNALVDSLIVGWVVPRRLAMTAKATLTKNPLIALVFRILGVVPLRRASDEARKSNGAPLDPSRNTGA